MVVPRTVWIFRRCYSESLRIYDRKISQHSKCNTTKIYVRYYLTNAAYEYNSSMLFRFFFIQLNDDRLITRRIGHEQHGWYFADDIRIRMFRSNIFYLDSKIYQFMHMVPIYNKAILVQVMVLRISCDTLLHGPMLYVNHNHILHRTLLS